ncbi:MAG TPA: transaldolase [Acidimicrobiales bacterium]|nr:transaldolase [Acidimicrobiales bacterium]
MTKLQRLYAECGQSPWLDNLRRNSLTSGELERLIERGIRGITSNPTIFQKAISSGADYDEQFESLVQRHETVEDAYWDLTTSDVSRALELLRPLYDISDGGDGFVSLELSPALAADTEASVTDALRLHERINRPNLLVKIPGTAEGVPAVERVIAAGRSVNVTLIFSLDRYAEVIEAYLSGLEACEGDLSRVHSVASFFVSRVDTEVDRRLDTIGTDEALPLRGKAAVAQAKLAYALFRERFAGPRWEALATRGARLQRPLWASTSTKNPAYPVTLYVDELIGPDSVNTMPEVTLEAFETHGTVARTVDRNLDQAAQVMDDLARVGVDVADVSRTLEHEGVAAFAKSYDELLTSLESKAAGLGA